MTSLPNRSLAALVLACLLPTAGAAVFQFAVPIETRRGERTAFLWLPPESRRIDGIVVGGMTLMEREMAKDPTVRAACEREDLAILFVKSGLRSIDLPSVLGRLAERSGYAELAAAPLFFVGHSAGGPQAKSLAIQMADRCFGLVQYRGGDPGGDEPLPPGIPVLMMLGQFDEFGKIGRDADGVENWEKDRDKMAAYRGAHRANLGSVVVEPGAGHFAWSERNADYLALFIRKAAEHGIPDGLTHARRIDPARGWLTGLNFDDQQIHPAAFGAYPGDKSGAAWHFDREMAEATVRYHQGLQRADQFIRWEDPHTVNAGARNFFSEVVWTGDGQTFVTHPTYAKTYPPKPRGRGAVWGKAGQPVGHSDSTIRLKAVSGPVVAVGDRHLRLQFDGLAPATEEARVTFMAYSEGDDQFRYTERVGMVGGEKLEMTGRQEQSITFPEPDDLRSTGRVRLEATSDTGLPVSYYVAHGPALVVDNQLQASEIPARAKFPIEVKVVAYQAGSGVEPLTKAANPVEHVIHIRR